MLNGGGRGRRAALVVLAALALAVLATVTLNSGRPTGPTRSPGIQLPSPPPGTIAPPPPTEPPTLPSSPASVAALLAAIQGPPEQVGYLVSTRELVDRAALARLGVEPFRSAFQELVDWANGKLGDDPRPKETLKISGTRGSFVSDTASAYGLAIAWVATGDSRYADQAREFINEWVQTTTATKDACPDTGGCQTALIISRAAAGFVFAADLLGPNEFGPSDQAALRDWLARIVLPAASTRDNNWGDAGTFSKVAVADYIGDRVAFDAGIAAWKAGIDRIQTDGHIPLEVARDEHGMMYTQEALDYKLAVAVIAERRGIDLWSYVGAQGGSLEKAVAYLASYWHRPEDWPWAQPVDVPNPSASWEIIYDHWPKPEYARILSERRPYGPDGHSAIRWTTMTNGLPFNS